LGLHPFKIYQVKSDLPGEENSVRVQVQSKGGLVVDAISLFGVKTYDRFSHGGFPYNQIEFCDKVVGLVSLVPFRDEYYGWEKFDSSAFMKFMATSLNPWNQYWGHFASEELFKRIDAIHVAQNIEVCLNNLARQQVQQLIKRIM